jgi:hypothetical protein
MKTHNKAIKSKKMKGRGYTYEHLNTYKKDQSDGIQYIFDHTENKFVEDPIMFTRIPRKNAVLVNNSIYDVNSIYEYIFTYGNTKDVYSRQSISRDTRDYIENKYNTLHKIRRSSPNPSYNPSYNGPLIQLGNKKFYYITSLSRYIFNNRGANRQLPPCPEGNERQIPNPFHNSPRNITIVEEPYNADQPASYSIFSFMTSRCYITDDQYNRIANAMLNMSQNSSYRAILI